MLFSLKRSKKNAATTTTGIVNLSGAIFKAVAMANVPKPTCDNPSPIMEYLFKTKLTPNNAAQSEISVPTTIARVKKG